jgi:enoyl-CoA hydratase
MSIIEYELNESVAIISLNRPERANAQNLPLLKELDAAYERAVADDAVKVIILRANGKHFSAGHDMAQKPEDGVGDLLGDVKENGLLRMYKWETKYYLGFARKWRDIPKPTIASVQGACIAAGLMLCWPCDLIVAAEDARFSDPVARMGIGGVEYHGHTWEFGARKAKEMLFTGGAIDAREAHRLGMVNRVVPRDELDSATLALAREIATMHPHALLMAKQAVNQTLDAMGQYSALQSVFSLHALGHANAQIVTGHPVMVGLSEMAKSIRETPTLKTEE